MHVPKGKHNEHNYVNANFCSCTTVSHGVMAYDLLKATEHVYGIYIYNAMTPEMNPTHLPPWDRYLALSLTTQYNNCL